MQRAALQRVTTGLMVAMGLATTVSAQVVVTPGTFIWQGASGGALTNAANWMDGNAPPNDGSAVLAFYTTGSRVDVLVNTSFEAKGLDFTFDPIGEFSLNQGGGNLEIGESGITVGSSSSGSNSVVFLSPDVALTASQTWTIGQHSSLYLWGELSGNDSLTIDGLGSVGIGGPNASPFAGDLTLNGGTLFVYESGGLGTGTVTLGDGSQFFAFTTDVVLNNPFRLGTGIWFGAFPKDVLTLAGPVEPLHQNTELSIQWDNELYIDGPISDSQDGATTLTVSGGGLLVLSGANTYSGGTQVDDSAVIFGNAGALPDVGEVQASLGGYIGAAYNGGAAEILAAISDPGSFSGTIGLDSHDSTVVFNDALDFSAFDASEFFGLGSLTYAIFNGTLTPVEDFAYLFGGGGGVLTVAANLVDPVPIRVQSVDAEHVLTVVFSGDNGSTGDMIVDFGAVILDSANALGGSIQLEHFGYAGHTQNWYGGELDFSDFVERLASYQATSVIGIDSVEGSWIVSDIDLSSLSDSVFLGTATEATIAGTITPTPDGILRLAAVKQGVLTVSATLDDNIQGLEIGNDEDRMSGRGVVVINGDNSNFSAGTVLENGALVPGNAQAFGTGELYVGGGSDTYPTVLATNGASITLANDIVIGAETRFQIGIPYLPEERDYAAFNSHSAPTHLRLTGQLSSSNSFMLDGDTILELASSNPDLVGTIELRGMSTLIAELNDSLGTAAVDFGNGTDLMLLSNAPVVHGVSGGMPFYDIEISDESFITLQSGAELTIYENEDVTLYANIGGQPADYRSDASPPAVNASLVKEGSGILRLRGTNTYFGGTTIRNGTLLLENSASQPGTGQITIDGGTLAILGGSFSNPVIALDGTLTGNGSFTSAVISDGAVLAPGYSSQLGSDVVGSISFSDLTLEGGGMLDWNIRALNGTAGSEWDLVTITSADTLHIMANSENRFVLRLSTINANGDFQALTGLDPEQPYSWKVFSAGSISGFDPQNFAFETDNFMLDGFPVSPSDFSISKISNDLFVNFTPVPEPSTVALIGTGLALAGASAWRRRRR